MDDAPTDDIESPEFGIFIGVYITLPGDDRESMVLARVKDRKRNHDGELVGTSNSNPILNTVVYNVETHDGSIQEYSANAIAENYGTKLTMMVTTIICSMKS